MKNFQINPLPIDHADALLVGRVWLNRVNGPCVVIVRDDNLYDITGLAPTMADLLDRPDLASWLKTCSGPCLGSVHLWLQRSLDGTSTERLLAPCDLQPIKACGVTFPVSLLERVLEEQAGGDADKAQRLREELKATIGEDIKSIRPGSMQAESLKQELLRRGLWSQYLEVGIGPDAEVFTKAAVMSAIGFGQELGLLPHSEWNNPEPEIVLAVNSRQEIVGATLGNDVNLRDVEGRSALLLARAKDNNGSCPIGPFIRVFDHHFNLDSVRAVQVSLRIDGEQDGYVLEDSSDMGQIRRDPEDLVRQASGAHHQYPDGFMLFLGTMFSPTQPRGPNAKAFTHQLGDRVTISAPPLGALINRVGHCDAIPQWTYGLRALYRNLASRGLDRSTPPAVTNSYPSLIGKRVVVTGGASGIGAVMVDGFVAQGARVVFLDVNRSEGEKLATQYEHLAHPPRFLSCDLTNLDAIQNTFAQVEQMLGGVDVLINNAANDDRHQLKNVTGAYWDGRIAVNLRHQYFCAQAVAPGMRQRRSGVILNLGSISWHMAMADLSIYMTAKAGIEGMTRGLARELGGDGIRVNCLVPGAVRTPRQTQLWRSDQADAQILAAQCLQQEVEPADIAAMALFLASDDAKACSGREYFVDAGMYGA